MNNNIEKDILSSVPSETPSSNQEVLPLIKPKRDYSHLVKAREKARLANIARKGKGTDRAKKALKIYTEAEGNITKGDALIKAGYSASVARSPSRVFSQEIFQHLLEDIPDKGLTEKLHSLALGDDGRTSLGALDMIFKLKDRYPQNKLRIDMFKEELGNLLE